MNKKWCVLRKVSRGHSCWMVCWVLVLGLSTVAKPSVQAFEEGWERSPIGAHAPTSDSTPFAGDAGTWLLDDTVSEFPECGPTPHRAEIVAFGSNKTLRLSAKDSASSCADNVWISFIQHPLLSNTTPIPLTSKTVAFCRKYSIELKKF